MQQIHSMLQEISRLLDEVDVKTTRTMAQAETKLTNINRLLSTYVSLSDKAGLPADAMAMMRMLLQLQTTIQATIMAINLLKTAYLTGGPAAWALGIGATAVAGFMLADQIELRRPTY